MKQKFIFRVMLFLLLSFIMLSFLVYPSFSQSGTVVKLDSPTFSKAVGESFTVTISISNVQNLYGLDVTLKWNPSLLQATNADVRLGVESKSDGILHESSNSPPIFILENTLTQSIGEYSLVGTSMAPASSFSGSGNIVKITFNTISAGYGVLDIESQLSDYPSIDRDPRTSYPIQHTTQDSTISITQSSGTQTPTPQPSISENPPTPTPTPPQHTYTQTPTVTHQPGGESRITLIAFSVVVIVVVLILAAVLLVRKQKNPITY